MEKYVFIIAAAVLMHVVWNLLTRFQRHECNFLWWCLLTHSLLFAPWTIYIFLKEGQWSSVLVIALSITAVMLSVYFIGLRYAYQKAAIALVYPIARSSALLIALWSLLFFRETLNWLGWAGILVSVIGLISLSVTARHSNMKRAVVWSLIAMFCTSVYSLSDKIAVYYMPGITAQLGYVSVAYFVALAAMSLEQYRTTGSLIPNCRPGLTACLIGGVTIGVSYALIINAMQYIPAAYVIVYTNASIVIASLISIVLLGEREHMRVRLLSIAVIIFGLTLVSFA